MVSTRPTCSWNWDAKTPATDNFLQGPLAQDYRPGILLSAYNPHTLIMCGCRYVADQKHRVSSREVCRIH